MCTVCICIFIYLYIYIHIFIAFYFADNDAIVREQETLRDGEERELANIMCLNRLSDAIVMFSRVCFEK